MHKLRNNPELPYSQSEKIVKTISWISDRMPLAIERNDRLKVEDHLCRLKQIQSNILEIEEGLMIKNYPLAWEVDDLIRVGEDFLGIKRESDTRQESNES